MKKILGKWKMAMFFLNIYGETGKTPKSNSVSSFSVLQYIILAMN
jgi:hypothetical protein